MAMWDTYIEYLKQLRDDFKKYKEYSKSMPDSKGDFLVKLCNVNLKRVNKPKGLFGSGKLKNLWEWIGFPVHGIGAFTNYEDSPEQGWIWRWYTDEGFNHWLFRGKDSIVLMQMMVDRVFHFWNAVRRGLVVDMFPLHNMWELWGVKR